MRFLPVNLSLILVELQSLEETMALCEQLFEQAEKLNIEEITPAARTVLVRFDPITIDANSLAKQIAKLNIQATKLKSGKLITIPVHYQGEDLIDVANYLQITPQEVIDRHTQHEYQVAFCGFAPGFAYMVSPNTKLNVPRRPSPRVRIPANSVALAGEFSSVYPQASPGGWQLIGITDTKVWDLNRQQPALLKPGYRVNFVDADKTSVIYSLPETTKQLAQTNQQGDLTVLATGLQTLIQDAGRTGQSALGISKAGAMDINAFRCANRIVGNERDEPTLEITQGGFKAKANTAMIVAITGATCEIHVTTCDGIRYVAQQYQPIHLAQGDIISLGQTTRGVRSYFAVRYGLNVSQVLGSASYDTLAQVGPSPLQIGQTFAIKPALHQRALSLYEQPAMTYPSADDVVVLDIILGPRTDWFTKQALELLTSQVWQVTASSNRIGLRLAGEKSLLREKQQELPSEGTCIGAIQIPANGQPVLFLNDHPLTGGYPVIGAVCEYHLDLAGQIPVNAKIKFNPIKEFKELEGNCINHVYP